MAIKTVCNSIIEIINDCCSNLKGAGLFEFFFFFGFPATYPFSSAKAFAGLTSKLMM